MTEERGGPSSDSSLEETVTRTIEGPTLVKELSSPATVRITKAPPAPLAFPERYMARSVLGEGGMGVVRLYDDLQIGRAIAMKEMRAEHRAHPEAGARFLREARIQGQLEHPAIVPVYDIGVNTDGSVYFTMKRVRGTTLYDVLTALRTTPELSGGRFSRRRLLTAFGSVCLAVDFAHRRGVLHRDLKPSNIMLGDFGEVYVLDWGLARVSGAEGMDDDSDRVRVDSVGVEHTQAGAVLGTPGYMSPEQIEGKHPELTSAADIYSLGAMLFEILALEPLHTAQDSTGLMASTLAGVDARLSWRAPHVDVAPELEAVVVKATVLDSRERQATAREIYEAIERHLDGERDLELRREMSAQHADAAEKAAKSARGGTETGLYLERREALREIGRALALDPDNERAMDTLVKLLADPPLVLPKEVRQDIGLAEREKLRRIGRLGAIAYGHLLLYVPILIWVGVRRWDWILAFPLLGLCAAGVSFYVSRQKVPQRSLAYVVMILANLTFGVTAVMFGPLFFMPMILAVNATGFALYMDRKARPAVAATAGGVTLLAFVLWAVDLLPGDYTFTQGGLLIHAGALALSPVPTMVLVTVANLAALFIGIFLTGRIRDSLDKSERQLLIYAWQLREFVPGAARAATDPTSTRRS